MGTISATDTVLFSTCIKYYAASYIPFPSCKLQGTHVYKPVSNMQMMTAISVGNAEITRWKNPESLKVSMDQRHSANLGQSAYNMSEK